MNQTLLRKKSAYFPLAMSAAGLALVLVHAARYGIVHEADEGATAHIWQILMAGQMPVLAFFAIKWLPRAPKPTLCVLSLQAVVALASMAPVFFQTVKQGSSWRLKRSAAPLLAAWL